MARRKNDNLFQRLTKLFRSGPVIKRRVKSFKQASASSAHDVFKKTLSHVYSTSMSAYGTYDRMARYSDYCFAPDTLIYTTQGIYTIEELSKDKVLGDRFHVYSYDYDKKKVVIGTAHSPRLARDGDEVDVVRVNFDTGGFLEVTPDHKMLLRDGTVKEAGELIPGEALMPFYVKDLMGSGYKWIYTQDKRSHNGFICEHKVVAEFFEGRELKENEEVHHIDFDRQNNSPENLKIMDRAEHRRYHAQLNNVNKLGKPNQKHSSGMFKSNHQSRKDISYEIILNSAIATDWSFRKTSDMLSADFNVIKRCLRKYGYKNWQEFTERREEAVLVKNHEVIVKETKSPEFSTIKESVKKGDTLYSLSSRLECTTRAIQRRIMSQGFANWSEFNSSLGYGNKYTGKKKGPTSDSSFTYQDVCSAYKDGMTLRDLGTAVGTSHNKVLTKIRNEGGTRNYSDWCNQYANHKVDSVVRCNNKTNVYNITVEKYHNLVVGNFADLESRDKIDWVVSLQSEMEYTPEIGSALDIFGEETAASDDKGQVLHIYSENSQIQRLLEDLFYDTLNVEFNLPAWVRDTCKYGDFFLFNDVSPEFGVLNVFPIPVNEIEREEGYDPQDPMAVRFRWVTQGNQILENWQVTHIRLLGNDAFLPYGSSVLESARRIWRQLILIEDAMLVYRVVRSPERRVFYIDVGNVPPEDVPNYMEQAKSVLRSNQVIDSSSGRVDMRYNPLSVDEDYFIPVRGGESGSKIDTLAGGANVTAIEDVEYIQKKLFSALKIPKAYLGYDEALGSKATLSQEDIRFSRTINRIQRTVLSELNKLAIIHLYSHGFEGEDILDFELNLSNPSTVAQQQKLEIYRTKLEIAGQAQGMEGIVDRRWIQKQILNLTDDQIERIQNGRMEDKSEDIKVESISAEESGEGSDADLGGGGFSGGGGGGDPGLEDDMGGEEGGDLEDSEDAAESADDDPGEIDSDLFASQNKEGDLLTSLDDELIDEDDDEEIFLSIQDEDAPIKAQQQMNKVLRNRKRRTHSGPEALSSPDILKMVSHKRPGDSLTDPYDMDSVNSSDPFKESHSFRNQVDNFLSDSVKTQARMTSQMSSTLKSLSKRIDTNRPRKVITESENDDNVLEVVLDDVDLDRE